MVKASNSAQGRDISVAIIGGGMSGICTAIKLKEAGLHNFTIYEKGSAVGGTWRDNTYPGIACDVPSHLYSFSFEPKPDWSMLYSPGKEIWDYFEHCVDKYGIRPHLRLDAEITSARFDEAAALWRLTLADGEEASANYLVSGIGALHVPNYPDIPGLDDFAGVKFHSSHWDHKEDLSGKRVAVIGSAASAIQIVPPVSEKAARVDLFQRTANWIVRRNNKEYSPGARRLFQNLPFLGRLHRWQIYWTMERRFPAFLQGSKRNKTMREECLLHMEEEISDPGMRAALTPGFAPGCKRILVSDDFYPALTRDNVNLVTRPIQRIVPEGVETSDGVVHPADIMVLATGFNATDLMSMMDVQGLGGVTLKEAWQDGAEAHRTIAVPGFPNLFMLLGPNSGLGHNSIIFMVEQQVDYLVQCIQAVRQSGARYLHPRAAVSRAFNDELQRDMARTIWKSGCNSWYQNDDGRVVALWPHGTVKYWRDMRRLRLDEYEIVK